MAVCLFKGLCCEMMVLLSLNQEIDIDIFATLGNEMDPLTFFFAHSAMSTFSPVSFMS